MKKLFALLLSLAMMLSLAACGSSTTTEQSDTTDTTETADTADTAETDDAAETDDTADAQETEDSAETEDAAETEDDTTDGEAAEGEATEIHVFIAASLSNAFDELVSIYNERYPNVKITLNADSSGTLISQIEEGYECDIFFSAANKQMKQLEEDGLQVEGTRVDLLQNEVVLITWKGSGTTVTGLDNLSEASSMALADGSVPAGRYTRAALQAMGVLDSSAEAADITTDQVSEALGGLEINECSNVSKVLQSVVEGSNEVGTVYYSDAYSEIDQIEILEHVSTDLTGSIVYPVAQVVNAEADEVQTQAAADFLAFLQTDEAMEVFETYMFIDNR